MKKKTSLTWQLIVTMIGIVAGTVVVCWFLNNTFLEKYYTYNKEKELLNGYRQVHEACINGNSGDNDISFERICADNNINMLITDRDRNLVWTSYNNAQRFQMQMDNWIYGTDRNQIQMLKKGNDYTLVRRILERSTG